MLVTPIRARRCPKGGGYFWLEPMRAGRPTLLLLILFTSCGHPEPARQVTSGSRYGGVFNMNETEPLRSIFPLTLTQSAAFRIMAQVYQGLVAFDPHDLSIVPCLADHWEVDATATQYTFHLRPGVRFHDDPAFPDGAGRALTADDVVRCFTAICTQGPGDAAFWLFQDRLEGANAYYAATAHGARPAEGVKGIQRLDDGTVRISLTHPSPNFLQIIAHQGCWIWPHELTEHYAGKLDVHAIGTGPFHLRERQPGDAMVLERNAHYWGKDAEGRPLPYLDAVRITFAQKKGEEFAAFMQGNLTAMSEPPVERLSALADSLGPDGKARFILRRKPALITQFYSFDLFHPPFNDRRVRQAFALAIDRRFLVDSVLGGLATPALHGIVAPGLKGYPYDSIPGIPFAPDSARALLAAAGYPDGAGFPALQLQLNSDGFGYTLVAEAVQAMLQRELHVPISLSALAGDEHYDRVDHLQARFWREGWTADHPDPENFLALLYGKNAVLDTTMPASINKTRFHDVVFDRYFALSLQEEDPADRLHDLAMAERAAMREMPMTPLYHEVAALAMQPWVRGLYVNAIEYLDLQAVWFDRPARAGQ